jgi:phenylacetic acid degradation protein
VSDEMIAWKTEGTRLYQSLPKRLYDSLKPCEPLRAVPADRPVQQTGYRTWHETRQT